jgi:outer membrane protein OmpA-like peptidoglycan-associated protein
MKTFERKEDKMPDLKALRAQLSMAVSLLLLSVLVGCAGMEVAPDGIWYPKELPDAGRAVEAARKAGKDKECPDEFKAAEKMKNDAYLVHWSCRTKEGIAMANEAANRANALCPKKVTQPPAPATPPAPPTPPGRTAPPALTVSLSASPASIEQGQCTTLTWSSSNASSVSIDQGVGRVDLSGSRQICPDSTTQYTIAAVGEGEPREASTTVTVRPRAIDRLTLHVNFDFDKSTVRNADTAELQNAIDFVKKYPEHKVSIEGHTDSIGSETYNQHLSERRAAAVKEYLAKHGVTDGARIKTAGHGESQPVADNSTEEGRFKNRRVEILILSE